MVLLALDPTAATYLEAPMNNRLPFPRALAKLNDCAIKIEAQRDIKLLDKSCYSFANCLKLLLRYEWFPEECEEVDQFLREFLVVCYKRLGTDLGFLDRLVPDDVRARVQRLCVRLSTVRNEFVTKTYARDFFEVCDGVIDLCNGRLHPKSLALPPPTPPPRAELTMYR